MNLFQEQIVHDEEHDEQALILTAIQDGHPVLVESEFIFDIMRLRAHDIEAYERVWELVTLLNERVNLPEIRA